MLKLVTLVAAGVLLAAAAAADVKLGAPFSDHMVLQRDLEVPVWGTADPGEKVTVAVDKDKKTATADADGKWSVKLSRHRAGGPHKLSIEGKNRIEFSDVLFGEVWVCSGQSNMAWPLSKSKGAKEDIAKANLPGIRLFEVPRNSQTEPTTSCSAVWRVCGPEEAKSFSAVGFYFGRYLHKEIGVPIGLIATSWGGTPVEAWMSRKALEAEGEFAPAFKLNKEYARDYPATLAKYEKARAAYEALKDAGSTTATAPAVPLPPERYQRAASVLYNGMVTPLVPYGIRGAIWYQGEANAGRAWIYEKLLRKMIESWRSEWNQGDFPFLIVQLANYSNVEPAWMASWAELREAQEKVARNTRNVGIATAVDIGETTDIHPKNKAEVGRRLGLVAEKLAYGRTVVASGPTYKSMKVEGAKIRITFDNVDKKGLVKRGEKLTGFIVASDPLTSTPAEARIEGNSVVVWSPEIKNPVAVRYAWENDPKVNLFNWQKLPAFPFRTDDWPLNTKPKR